MQSNPILTFFKICAFALLAFLVWQAWWQGLKREDKTIELVRLVT